MPDPETASGTSTDISPAHPGYGTTIDCEPERSHERRPRGGPHGISQPELPTDVDYVRVMSLHKSKGLTADLVVVMGCVEGLTPHVEKSLSQAEQNRMLEEQRRLFYVALTRSRDTLILSSVTNLPRHLAHRLRMRIVSGRQNVSTIASRFLDELGPTRPNPVNGAQLLATTAGV